MSPEVPEDEGREADQPTSAGRLGSVVAMARSALDWALAHRARAALLAGACVVSLAGALGTAITLLLTGGPSQDVSMEDALSALDAGDYEEARRVAKILRSQPSAPWGTLGAAAYVLGAVAAHDAEDVWKTDAKGHFLVAARYLEEARDRGFPPSHLAEGTFLLGYCLYRSDQFAACRAPLEEALQSNSGKRTQIHRLLAAAYLDDASPKPENALEHNTRFLAPGGLSPQVRSKGLVQRAEILLRMGRTSQCMEALRQVPEGTQYDADALVLRGQVLMHEALALQETEVRPRDAGIEFQEKLHEAIKAFRLAQGRDTLATPAGLRATYLIGVCLSQLGDHGRALGQLVEVSRTYTDTAESLAADFLAAGLLQRLGRDQDALERYRRAVEAVRDPRSFSNPWLTLDELKRQLLGAYESYFDKQQFAMALELAELLGAVLGRARSIELRAETHRAWGRSLVQQAENLPPSQADGLRKDGRRQLRRAGAVYSVMAAIRTTTRAYPEDLWASAESYVEGQNYRAAEAVLREYTRSEAHGNHPQALVYLGQSLLALGKVDEALAQLRRCIEYHSRDAASFQARLLASAAYQEDDQLDEAEALLRENLDGDFLTPASPEWRDSLFALGRLLHGRQSWDEAIRRMEEAVGRYTDDPKAIEGHYLLGDCWRQQAHLARLKLQSEVVATLRARRAEKLAELRAKALNHFQQSQKMLETRRQHLDLAPHQLSTLRNCHFAVGALQFDLGQYEAAIETYSMATQRWQDSPEVLEAYLQLARSYRQLDREEEARGAVQQAKLVLNRMQSVQDFTTTNYSKEEWSKLFDRMSQTTEEAASG